MKDKDIGFLPVCDEGGKAVGTLTDRDVTIRVVAEGKDASTKVLEVMTTEVVSCSIEDDVDDAARLMAQHEVSRILITDADGKPAGVISLGDLASQDEDDAGDTLAAVKEGVEQHP
jgi:CBS domain-containing protein